MMDGLRELGDRWGTPLYVVSLDRLRQDVDRVRQALAPAGVRLLFSLKTNYLPDITRAIAAAGLGVDVVSGYELRAAVDAGFAPADIVFNGPVKTPAELRAAAEAGVYINVDSEPEIEELARIAAARGRTVDVGLRVYPPHDVYAADATVARRHHPSKFGWPIADGSADRLAKSILDTPGLRLTGVHCHLGSQITDHRNLLAALGTVLEWTAALRQRAVDLAVLNIGGGFGVPGIHRVKGVVAGLSEVRAGGTPAGPAPEFDLPAFGSGLAEALRAVDLADLTVYAEPGRALVSASTVLLTRVAAVKRLGDGAWVLLDGGLNLMPTAGVAERHHFDVVDGGDRPLESFMVGGPLCYEGDVFGLDVPLPAGIEPGEYVAIRDAGAYGLTRATSFNRTRAAVAVVDGGRARLAWRAETYEDVMRFAVL
jgi:diaminopimelate decarboxylase